ncbi:hypothetical protein YC2023_073612 [Brassica napus]
MQDLSKTEAVRRSIPWVLWLIWKNRNSVIYAHVQESLERLLRVMFEEVEQWFELNKVQPTRTDMNTRLEGDDIWRPPEDGGIKCNIHANWRNAHLHSGVAWVARDQRGNVLYHARDAITHAPNRFVAELRCVLWSLSSLRDLGVSRVTVAVDYHEVIEALKKPQQWPRYRILLEKIRNLKEEFDSLDFEEEKILTNRIARDIAKSVLRDGRFQSYLALGGPSWLHDRIAGETIRSDV